MKKALTVALLAVSTMTSVAPIVGYTNGANATMPQQIKLATGVNYPTIVDSILRNQSQLDRTVDRVWNEFGRGTVTEKIKQQLEGRQITRKIKIYDTQVNLTNITSKQVSRIPGTNKIRMQLVLPGNNTYFKTTTPSIFGSYANPSFRVFYDLTLNVTMSVDQSANPIKVDELNIQVSNARYRGANITGTVAKAMGDFFTGGGFSNSIVSRVNQEIDLRAQLANAITPVIQQFRPN